MAEDERVAAVGVAPRVAPRVGAGVAVPAPHSGELEACRVGAAGAVRDGGALGRGGLLTRLWALKEGGLLWEGSAVDEAAADASGRGERLAVRVAERERVERLAAVVAVPEALVLLQRLPAIEALGVALARSEADALALLQKLPALEGAGALLARPVEEPPGASVGVPL